jgi:DNA-binding transcriptional MerR regulator/methylmalonyl-CoA mutase cobalamin-binding subunit
MSNDSTDQEPRHPIRVVSERTGLSPDVLRAWEKRYTAVSPPRRDGAGQRLYSDADVERLRLLRRVTQAGRAIGQVADLTNAELLRLAREDEDQRASALPPVAVRQEGKSAPAYLERGLAAARALDARGLETVLRRALVALGAEAFIDEVAVPFLRALGTSWEEGKLTIAHEHLASAVMGGVLGMVTDVVDADSGGMVIVATPARQRHELGALLAAATAATAGWRVTYLGADLPADDIAAAARQRNASAVALSVVYPTDVDALAEEMRRLRSALPPHVEIIAGGEGARRLGAALTEAGVTYLPTLADFRKALVRLSHRRNGNGDGHG